MQDAGKTGKKNRAINTLTAVLGLLTGRPTVTGAGILAQSRQEVLIPWSRVTKVKYKPKSYTVLLSGGLTEHIALFCAQDNYVEAERFVKNELAGRAQSV